MPIQVRKQRRFEGLVNEIRRQIHDGVLQADHYLLPEDALAQKYAMSTRAVRQGLARLEAEGLIRRYQGRGTVILPYKERQPEVVPQVKNVAVIFQGRVSDATTAEELDGFQQSFQREGYGTTLYVADAVPETETQIVEQLSAEGVPGLVLYSAHARSSYAHLQAAQDKGMKIVVYDHDFPELDCNFVGIDDQLAAYEATEHLIRLGCRELLMVNAERDWTTTILRQRGFEQAVAKYGAKHRLVLLQPIYPSLDARREQLCQKLPLAEVRRPLGVLAWSDEVAIQAIDCLRDAGWSVPGDARVVGIGNEAGSASAPVPLTTMENPRKEITRMAAAALVNQMRFPNRPAQRIRLKARMIIRESCGNYARFAHRDESRSTANEPVAQGAA